MTNIWNGKIPAEPGATLRQNVLSEVHCWPAAPVAAEYFRRIAQGCGHVAVWLDPVAARLERIYERLGRFSVLRFVTNAGRVAVLAKCLFYDVLDWTEWIPNRVSVRMSQSRCLYMSSSGLSDNQEFETYRDIRNSRCSVQLHPGSAVAFLLLSWLATIWI